MLMKFILVAVDLCSTYYFLLKKLQLPKDKGRFIHKSLSCEKEKKATLRTL